MRIRHAGLGDLAAIAAIECGVLSPWSASQIEEELLHKQSITLIVTDDDVDEGIGWCSVRVVPPECELLKISILPRYRKQGVGSLLLSAMIGLCFRGGCQEMYLEVRESNRAARAFYESTGFKKQGCRKAYYTNPVENAILMKMVLGQKKTSPMGGNRHENGT